MELHLYHLWILIAILLFVIEIFSPVFVSACFAIAFILTAIASYMKVSINIQIIVFFTSSLIIFWGVRPFMLKYFYKASHGIKTNRDALFGKSAIVTEQIKDDKGYVKIDGDYWKAKSYDNKIIDTGMKVQIIEMNGIILTVKQI